MNYQEIKSMLQGEYQETFKKAELYGLVGNIDTASFTEGLEDLGELLLTAQAEQRPVTQIVGEDINSFCQEYFSGVTNRDRVRGYFRSEYYFFCCVFVIELIALFVSLNAGDSLLQARTDIAGYLVGTAAGLLLDILALTILKPLFFRWKGMSTWIVYLTVLLSIGSIVLFWFAFPNVSLEIPSLAVLLVSGGYVLCYFLTVRVRHWRKTGHLRNSEKISNQRDARAQREERLAHELVRLYEQRNEYRAKKGKPEISPQEYMEKLKKEPRQLRIAMIAQSLFLLAMIISQFFTSEVLDAAIFALILCAIELPILRFLFHLPAQARQSLLDKCVQADIDLFQYVKRLNEEPEEPQ
ncbi:MAG: hypothetical protein LUH42_08500 [Oscillospiraceae bacterium]|nr:hypothetical protein [Oscillospiraceae bacterium]